MRAATVVAIAIGVTVLAAACGGSPGGRTKPQTPPTAGALAFSACMRAHAVPRYPDPARDGVIAKKTPQQLGVSTSGLEAAQAACAHLLPNGGSGPTVAALQRSWNDFRTFARCMRSHGIARWPDPSRYPQHPERPTFDLQAAGIDASSPRIDADARTCLPALHGNNPQRLGEAGS